MTVAAAESTGDVSARESMIFSLSSFFDLANSDEGSAKFSCVNKMLVDCSACRSISLEHKPSALTLSVSSLSFRFRLPLSLMPLKDYC
jgi:hypothetical protein